MMLTTFAFLTAAVALGVCLGIGAVCACASLYSRMVGHHRSAHSASVPAAGVFTRPHTVFTRYTKDDPHA